MKKITTAILAVLYMSASMGATVNLHYCMGKLIGADMKQDSTDSDKCDACGMPKNHHKKDCCKDEHKQIKLTADQKIADKTIAVTHFTGTAILPDYLFYKEFPVAYITEKSLLINAPPRKQAVSLFILNCVFRI